MIQDFEISITAVGGDQYLIRTENVAKGVQLAEERVRWPVAQWLEKTQSLMHDPLLGLLKGQQRRSRTNGLPSRASAGSRVPTTATEAATLVHLGQTLHKALFQGQLHDSWIAAQGIAHNRQNLLRLRIGMKDNRLQQLPWEALHAGTRPLATGTDVIFSRYILDRRQGHSLQLDERKESDKVLKILMVIASPDDQERLELKQEVEHLRSELHPTERHPTVASSRTGDGALAENALLDIQLTLLEQPGRAELTQELDRGNYQVLHYAGHSDLGNAGGDLYLVSRQTGLTERLSGEDLAGLLVNNGIQLAVFNSCRGGYSPSGEQGWQERNLAQALVNRGMPSVIAMAERIPDDVAITFTQLLYRNLKKGQAIDLSLNRTRQGLISAYGSHQFYWALPTLYMQPSFNGYLLEADGDHEQAERLEPSHDPFDEMFASPGLGSVDWSMTTSSTGEKLETRASAHRSSARNATTRNAITRNAVTRNDSVRLASHTATGVTDTANKMNPRKLLDNDDAILPDGMVKRPEAPSAAVDIDAEIDGELRVPEDIQTPRGFYGEPIVEAAPASQPAASESAVPKRQAPEAAVAAASPAHVSNETPSDEAPSDDEELIGERLPRSHTLHTKILTVPGIAMMAFVLLSGVLSVGLWQRMGAPDPTGANPTRPNLTDAQVQSELGLPAQIEVALLQENIDAAIGPTQELIENGEFIAAITALETATNRQQQDVIVLFFRGRAQWGLVKQGSTDFSADDAMRSWRTALDSEPDWMEIAMALGFAQYAIGREQQALESWEQAIALSERQSDSPIIYFSEQAKDDYMLNAYAGLAMVSLALSKIEVNPNQRNQLLDQAVDAYQKVMNEAPADFSPKALGNNWLWLSPAIADWVDAKRELSQIVE